LSHPVAQDIFETDHPLLKKISKIEHIPSNENDNFEIKFHFFPNDYIENQWLSVKFTMLEDGQDPEKAEATEVKWKEGKDITKKTVTKKQKNKKTGKTRSVEKVVDAESFFNFFKSVAPKDGGDDADDEEGGDEDLERLNINFDIATTLQEEIVPYHLEYYLGLRKGDDYGALGEDGEDDDEDGGDDDDDEPEEKV
jgi:nucleosome assembly protein 1-like 1